MKYFIIFPFCLACVIMTVLASNDFGKDVLGEFLEMLAAIANMAAAIIMAIKIESDV